MTLEEVLNLMDHEVWVRVRVNDGRKKDPANDLVFWSADWIGGGLADPGMPTGLEDYLDLDADDLSIERHPTDGQKSTPMIVVNVYPQKYRLRYRGCAKGDTPPTKEEDPKVGEIVEWTLAEILEEINRDRSEHWTDYDETDWKEGLDEWTWYELIGE